MGGMTALGAVVGLLLLGFALPVSHAYAMYALALTVSTPCTWMAAVDKPQDGKHLRQFEWRHVAECYYISPQVLKASYTSSVRPHTLVLKASYTSSLRSQYTKGLKASYTSS